jgi:hypothetical protein
MKACFDPLHEKKGKVMGVKVKNSLHAFISTHNSKPKLNIPNRKEGSKTPKGSRKPRNSHQKSHQDFMNKPKARNDATETLDEAVSSSTWTAIR